MSFKADVVRVCKQWWLLKFDLASTLRKVMSVCMTAVLSPDPRTQIMTQAGLSGQFFASICIAAGAQACNFAVWLPARCGGNRHSCPAERAEIPGECAEGFAG